MTILASLLLHGVTALISSMSILSLTFFRRHQKQGPLERLKSDSLAEDSSGVVGRLERMLVRELPPSEATPVTTGKPAAPVSAHPRDDKLAGASLRSEAMALEDVSVVSVIAPPEVMASEEAQVEALSPQAPINNDTVLELPNLGLEPQTSPENIEVRLMAALDDAHTEREARRLAEQERDHVRHESRHQLDRLESELADAVEKVRAQAVSRREVETELERVKEEARHLASERDRTREESKQQLDRLEGQLAGVVSRLQTEAVRCRAAEMELERYQEESARRLSALQARLSARHATEAAATAPTAKAAKGPAKSTTARKPAGAARKTRSAMTSVPARLPKTVKTSAAGTRRNSSARKASSTGRSRTKK